MMQFNVIAALIMGFVLFIGFGIMVYIEAREKINYDERVKENRKRNMQNGKNL